MPAGGSRSNAGRPKGKGPYGEPTRAVRLPVSRIDEIKAWLDQPSCRIPLYLSKVSAGFPSPAEDQIEQYLDLNQHLIEHPAATFMVRAQGDSMIGAGIHSGDILVVDRSKEPAHGKVVVVALDGELTVKRLVYQGNGVELHAENPAYKPIVLKSLQQLVVWGVVTSVIHQLD